MELILELPKDLFEHTLTFYNPLSDTAKIIDELQTTFTIFTKRWWGAHPNIVENKGLWESTQRLCTCWASYCESTRAKLPSRRSVQLWPGEFPISVLYFLWAFNQLVEWEYSPKRLVFDVDI